MDELEEAIWEASVEVLASMLKRPINLLRARKQEHRG